jgi:hypothetical protein
MFCLPSSTTIVMSESTHSQFTRQVLLLFPISYPFAFCIHSQQQLNNITWSAQQGLLTNTLYGSTLGRAPISIPHIGYMSRFTHDPKFRILHAFHWLGPTSFSHLPPNDNFSRDLADMRPCVHRHQSSPGVPSSFRHTARRKPLETLIMRRGNYRNTRDKPLTRLLVVCCFGSDEGNRGCARTVRAGERFSGLIPPDTPRHGGGEVLSVCICEGNQQYIAASCSEAHNWSPR